MTTQEDFLAGGKSYPAIKPETIGEVVRGTLLDTPQIVQRPNLNDPTVMEDQMIVNMMVTKADGTSEERTLWVRKGFMSTAIGEACAKHGPGTKLVEGGTLAVAWTSETDTGKPIKARVYQAQYTPPVAAPSNGVAATDIFAQ